MEKGGAPKANSAEPGMFGISSKKEELAAGSFFCRKGSKLLLLVSQKSHFSASKTIRIKVPSVHFSKLGNKFWSLSVEPLF